MNSGPRISLQLRQLLLLRTQPRPYPIPNLLCTRATKQPLRIVLHPSNASTFWTRHVSDVQAGNTKTLIRIPSCKYSSAYHCFFWQGPSIDPRQRCLTLWFLFTRACNTETFLCVDSWLWSRIRIRCNLLWKEWRKLFRYTTHSLFIQTV